MTLCAVPDLGANQMFSHRFHTYASQRTQYLHTLQGLIVDSYEPLLSNYRHQWSHANSHHGFSVAVSACACDVRPHTRWAGNICQLPNEKNVREHPKYVLFSSVACNKSSQSFGPNYLAIVARNNQQIPHKSHSSQLLCNDIMRVPRTVLPSSKMSHATFSLLIVACKIDYLFKNIINFIFLTIFTHSQLISMYETHQHNPISSKLDVESNFQQSE